MNDHATGPLSLDAGVLDAAVELVMRHEWQPGHNFSATTAHANHVYDAYCAVCRGDVRRVLEVALSLGLAPCPHDDFGRHYAGCGCEVPV